MKIASIRTQVSQRTEQPAGHKCRAGVQPAIGYMKRRIDTETAGSGPCLPPTEQKYDVRQ